MSKQEKSTNGVGYFDKLAQEIKEISEAEGLNESLKKRIISMLIDKGKQTPEYQSAKTNRNKSIKDSKESIKQIGEAYKNLGDDQRLQNRFTKKVSKEVGLPKAKKENNKKELSDRIEIDGGILDEEDYKVSDVEWKKDENGENKIFSAENDKDVQYMESEDGNIRQYVGGKFDGKQQFNLKGIIKEMKKPENKGVAYLSPEYTEKAIEKMEGENNNEKYQKFKEKAKIDFGGYSYPIGYFNNLGKVGYYWCPVPGDTYIARYMKFYSDGWDHYRFYEHCFFSVRLVRRSKD